MIIFHDVSMTEGSPLDTNFARHTTISLDTFCFWLLLHNFTHFSSSSLITVNTHKMTGHMPSKRQQTNWVENSLWYYYRL